MKLTLNSRIVFHTVLYIVVHELFLLACFKKKPSLQNLLIKYLGVTFTYLNCWSIKRNFVYVMSVRKFGEINTQRELKWLEYTYTYSLNPSIKCFSTRIYLLCKQQSLSEPFKCVGQNFSRWHPLIMHTPSQTYNYV